MIRLSDLAAGRTALLGLGREGRSVMAALERLAPGLSITVHAEQPPDPPPGRHRLVVGRLDGQLQAYDYLVRSPGVPVDHPALIAARTAGVRVVTATDLWRAERPRARVLAVTGSKGKSTTASLIAHLLRAAGRETVLAGNIGVPVLDHLETRAEVFVLELSSYQLADLRGRVDAGVITRLFPEHLDWHGGRQAYFDAKLRLLERLEGGPLVINTADPVLEVATRDYPNRIRGNLAPLPVAGDDGIRLGERVLLAPGMTALVGRHNLDNIATALAACGVEGLDPADVATQVAGFAPLPHRLQPLATADRRTWINDSIATTPEATLAALRTLAGRPVVLLAGGLERGADWTPVWDWLASHPLAALIALPDNGARIADEAERHAGVADRVEIAGRLAGAVTTAADITPAGGVVLLSPGAPSFPHFRDFEDRGRQFADQVARLAGGSPQY